ncbi:MAG: beta-galactosidase, partial [Prevotellaceae bacterium]|jgi:beta-galactosidase|nr:beta-galactosidase [Prevotellaceae bacterium]
VLCTSTATPPVWLVRKHPDVQLTLENGQQMAHGGRQHASFSNSFYREYAKKMIEQLASRYGKNEAIVGWQLDNEPRSQYDYGRDAQQRFRAWLKKKYSSIATLNKAWGAAFWSQTYAAFDEVEIPKHSTQWGINPHQLLDHDRFCAAEVSTFLDEQTHAIRRHTNGKQWITTNYIPEYNDGHLRQSDSLDFQSYTRYMVFGEDYGLGRNGFRLGPVERIAKANDFFRPISGVYGVMELQPGQVNWGSINPQPLPGAVRLWLWQVLAGGSKFICTYRYRQPTYGMELYHYGIVGPDGVTPTSGGLEYAQFIKDIATLRKHANPNAALPSDYAARRTAILYNHENSWDMERNKQTRLWSTERHVDKYYSALKSFGAPVDFVQEKDNFAAYKLLVAPAYEMVDSALLRKWESYVDGGGTLVLTCRSGHKDRNGQLFESPYASAIRSLIGAGIDFYDLLLPRITDTIIFGSSRYPWNCWGEALLPDKNTEVWATHSGDFYAGKPAVSFVRKGKGAVCYLGVDSRDGDLERDVLKKIFATLNTPLANLPAGLHIEYRDGFGIAVNYSDKPCTLPLSGKEVFLIGEATLKQAGVAVWKMP